MKKVILSLLILLGAGSAYAKDRFGNERSEIPRSSWTASAEIGVTIASNPTGGGSPMVLRSISCSGVVATTITVVDANVYTINTTTRIMFSYVPTQPTAGLGAYPSQIFYDQFFSSGITYTKTGTPAPCNISWDFLVEPRFNVPYRQ